MTGVTVDTAGLEAIKVERIGEVLRLTIAHPSSALNAVDDLLHHELTTVFGLLRREQAARAVILTGTGKAFSAGGDFGWFPSLQKVERLHSLRRDAKQLIWDLVDIEIPLVAALNGPAVGLGASIALLCDVIVAADTATISDPHVRVGIVAGDGGTAIWPLLIGPARAKEYLLTGDPLTAREAERIGLINRVVSVADLSKTALEIAARLAALPPLAVQYTKAAVNKLIKDALNTSFDFAAGHELVTFLSDDHREALAAMAEKRPPRFQGR
ncbi:MAG: enoyl-CoA hydratase-related protein [Acidimicrobiia bacterium]